MFSVETIKARAFLFVWSIARRATPHQERTALNGLCDAFTLSSFSASRRDINPAEHPMPPKL
jgi:hypothetical protein